MNAVTGFVFRTALLFVIMLVIFGAGNIIINLLGVN